MHCYFRLLIAIATIGGSLAATVSVAAEAAVGGLSKSESASGWRLLFDGQTTDGWRNFRKQTIGNGWEVKDGVLSRDDKGAGDIVTTKQFERFELSLEYNISQGGNSGIMFHVTEDEDRPWKTGPEVQLQDNVDGHDPQKSGWLYQLYKPVTPRWVKQFEAQAGIEVSDTTDATRPAGQWNHVYLRVTPEQSEVVLNGNSYYRFRKGTEDWNKRVAASKFSKFPKFGKPTRGHICLQDHGNPIAFRNIKIRELPQDGSVPNPVDGKLSLKRVNAFPDLTWEGWENVDDQGKVRSLRPIVLKDAGDGSGVLYAATQSGMVHAFANQRTVSSAKLILDLRPQVAPWKKNNEEGLLGLAFHPEFKTNRQFFVYYTATEPPRSSVVSRFRIATDDPLKAIDPTTEEVLIKIPQPFGNHNGGSIEFGPDGYLYIGFGDGGSRNDPLSNGQNLKSLMGSILRIDVDGKQADRAYGIPDDNPFVDDPQARGEIFAYGFRNVWRLGFDRQTGALWVADVGQDLWEEINVVQRGGNYGWKLREGCHAFGNTAPAESARLINPVWEYDHRVGRSITGGFVYRGLRLPQLQGCYVYADYVSGKIWALRYDANAKKVVENLSLADGGLPVLAFGQDENNELYYLVESSGDAGIFRFEESE